MSEILYGVFLNIIWKSQQHVQNLHLKHNSERNPMSIQICQCTVQFLSIHWVHTWRSNYARRTNVTQYVAAVKPRQIVLILLDETCNFTFRIQNFCCFLRSIQIGLCHENNHIHICYANYKILLSVSVPTHVALISVFYFFPFQLSAQLHLYMSNMASLPIWLAAQLYSHPSAYRQIINTLLCILF